MYITYKDMQNKMRSWQEEGKLVATVDCGGIRFIQVGQTQNEALEKVKQSIEIFLSNHPQNCYESL